MSRSETTPVSAPAVAAEGPTEAGPTARKDERTSESLEQSYGASAQTEACKNRTAKTAEESATTAIEHNEPNTGAEQSAPSAAIAVVVAEQGTCPGRDSEALRGCWRKKVLARRILARL